eukprot:s1_g860.t1
MRQLIMVKEARSLRKAADLLGVTHSALSQTISKLEREYDVPLFARHKRETVPTAYGARLIAAMERSVRELEEAKREIEQMRNLDSGQLRIGVDANMGEGVLAPVLIEMMKSWPHLRILVVTGGTAMMEQDLITKKIDLYIGFVPDRRMDNLQLKDFLVPAPSLIVRKNHPLTKGAAVTIDDIVEYPMISGDAPNWVLQMIQKNLPEVFQTIEQTTDQFLITQDMALVRKLLLSTDAVSYLLAHSHLLDDTSLVALDVEDNPITTPLNGLIAWSQDYPLPPVAEAFLGLFQKTFDQSAA